MKYDNMTDNDSMTLIAELQYCFDWMDYYPPTLKQLSEKFETTEEEMRQCYIQLINPIKARGLPLPDWLTEDLFTENQILDRFTPDPTRPDPTFMMVAQEILDINNTKSFAAKLKKFEPLGVKTSTWNNWMKNPVNADYFRKMLDKRFSTDLDDIANLALARNIAAADLPSIKYYKELTNRYRPQDRNTQSLAILMQMVMEILARNVSPDIIGKVADELDNLPIIINIDNKTEAPALNAYTNDEYD